MKEKDFLIFKKTPFGFYEKSIGNPNFGRILERRERASISGRLGKPV
jgi:hypothetical protein